MWRNKENSHGSVEEERKSQEKEDYIWKYAPLQSLAMSGGLLHSHLFSMGFDAPFKRCSTFCAPHSWSLVGHVPPAEKFSSHGGVVLHPCTILRYHTL